MFFGKYSTIGLKWSKGKLSLAFSNEGIHLLKLVLPILETQKSQSRSSNYLWSRTSYSDTFYPISIFVDESKNSPYGHKGSSQR